MKSPDQRLKSPTRKNMETEMLKTFLRYGLESGMRFNTPARGYESRNRKISLSSSTEAPVSREAPSNGTLMYGSIVEMLYVWKWSYNSSRVHCLRLKISTPNCRLVDGGLYSLHVGIKCKITRCQTPADVNHWCTTDQTQNLKYFYVVS